MAIPSRSTIIPGAQPPPTGASALPRPTTQQANPPGLTAGYQPAAFNPITSAPQYQQQGSAMQGATGMAGQAPGGSMPSAPQQAGEGYGPGFGETYGKENMGYYNQPTQLEQFATQQMNGTNPYYDRLRSSGMDSLNQQMIARGHGNSGGALAALGNYGGALDAAQFKDMGDLIGNASGLGFQRQQAGMGQAANIQGLQQGRLGQQFGMLSDISHLGAGTIGGFYGQGGQLSGDAAMAGVNAGANASQLQGQGQNALPNMLMQGANIYASRPRQPGT